MLFCLKKRGELMKKFINEFKQFAMRGNMLDMAIGVIIGGAFTGIVTSLTDNFINPILNFFTGGRIYSLQDIARGGKSGTVSGAIWRSFRSWRSG